MPPVPLSLSLRIRESAQWRANLINGFAHDGNDTHNTHKRGNAMQTYTLQQIRQGTGWERNAQFVSKADADELAAALLNMICAADDLTDGQLSADCEAERVFIKTHEAARAALAKVKP